MTAAAASSAFDEMTAMLDASTAAALVAAVEHYRRTTGASLLTVGHGPTLLHRWCDRVVTWETPTGDVPA